jgi:hypothetical protein
MRLMRLSLANDSVDHATFRSLERLVRHVTTHELVFTDSLAAAERLGAALDPGAHA